MHLNHSRLYRTRIAATVLLLAAITLDHLIQRTSSSQ